MEKDKIQKIISELEVANSEDDAHFAIYQYGGGPEESFIKANKSGLELFAADILKASRDFNEVLEDEKKPVIPLNYEAEWIDGMIYLQYVEPSNDPREKTQNDLKNTPVKDKLIGIGCGLVLIIIVVALIVGLTEMVYWFL